MGHDRGGAGRNADTGVTGSYDCVGLFGPTCLQPTPEWRHNARLSFNAPSGVGMSVRWRYFGNVKVDATNANSNLNNTGSTGPAPGGVARPGLAELGVQSYFDLAMTFRVSDAYTFRLGANNLLDREPPLSYRLSMLSSIHRPVWLRRRTYRLARHPAPPAWITPPWLRTVLDMEMPYMRGLFHMDRLKDPDALNRVLTVEYLCQRAGAGHFANS